MSVQGFYQLLDPPGSTCMVLPGTSPWAKEPWSVTKASERACPTGWPLNVSAERVEMKKSVKHKREAVELLPRGRVYLELSVEILSGGSGHESKLLKLVKPGKEPKGGKAAAGGGAGGGGGGEADKAVGAEVLPVESPPTVGGVTASPDETK